MTSDNRKLPPYRWLHTLRQRHDFTQQQTADFIGIGLKTYRKAERDGSVSPGTKRLIGEFFGYPIERIKWG